MRARHRIGKFLLRREIYWEGPGETWSRKHRSWLTSVRFADHASRATLADYLHAHDVLIARRDQVEADLAKLAPSVAVRAHGRAGCGACAGSTRSPRSGCAPRSASGSASIIPTSSRPTSGSSPQSTPPAASGGSGRSPRPAPPTPAGCWSRPPTTTAAAPRSVQALERRQRGHAPEIINISWKAQRRLNARWRQLKDARRKPGGIVAVAIARELAAYCWEIAT